MKLNKAQISSQVFTYILAAVIIGVIMIVGYSGISTVLSATQKAPIDNFKSEFTGKIKSLSRDYGSIETMSFNLPKFDKVCFVDSMNDNNEFEIDSNIVDNKFIQYSVEDNVDKNVFLLDDEGSIQESFYVEDMDVVSDYLCVDTANTKIWFEGIGKKACLKNEQMQSCE